jgi:NTE family protein
MAFADLVFEGGGVKGIGLAGAFAALEARGYEPKKVAGTSAGAITAALVAAGYSAKELDEILLEVPFDKFRDEGPEDKVPILRRLAVLREKGVYEGAFFRQWMADLLAEKGKRTFGDLLIRDDETGATSYRLQVIASDVSHKRLLVLPRDAQHLGCAPDDLEIAYAVRMSMSIPIFFEPVVHENPDTETAHLIVDGGMLSNFPVWLFDATKGQPPRWPTFGLMLVEPEPKREIGERIEGGEDGTSLFHYVKSMAQTMMAAHDRMYLEQSTRSRTIKIPTLGVGTTEFDITPERVRMLHASGYKAASEFLDNWDFDAYIAEHRSDGP